MFWWGYSIVLQKDKHVCVLNYQTPYATIWNINEISTAPSWVFRIDGRRHLNVRFPSRPSPGFFLFDIRQVQSKSVETVEKKYIHLYSAELWCEYIWSHSKCAPSESIRVLKSSGRVWNRLWKSLLRIPRSCSVALRFISSTSRKRSLSSVIFLFGNKKKNLSCNKVWRISGMEVEKHMGYCVWPETAALYGLNGLEKLSWCDFQPGSFSSYSVS